MVSVTTMNMGESDDWEFDKKRKLPHPTSDFETLMHMLKSAIGSGILGMPMAFKHCGIFLGVIFTFIISIICTHCAYILIECTHILYKRMRVTQLTFAEVGEAAFANGPEWGRKYSNLARISIRTGLFATYFGSCSVYTVIIAQNFKQVLERHTSYSLNIRAYITAFLFPLILLTWIPNLKSLVPVSLVANVFMFISVGITSYYLCGDLGSPLDMPQVAPIEDFPIYFSITIFAMESIGVVMALENNMKTPKNFIGMFGILNKGMAFVTVVYVFLGFMGYLKYGDAVEGSITLNLPTEDYAAQAVKLLVAAAIFSTFAIQYFVCLDILWNAVKRHFKNHTTFYEYLVRTMLTTAAVLLAAAVPTIGPFMALIGALCFAFLGLMVPITIQTIVYWDVGFGPFKYLIWKNITLFIFAILALVFGSYTSILDIIEEYTEK